MDITLLNYIFSVSRQHLKLQKEHVGFVRHIVHFCELELFQGHLFISEAGAAEVLQNLCYFFKEYNTFN